MQMYKYKKERTTENSHHMVLGDAAHNRARRLPDPFEAETTIAAVGRAIKRQREVEVARDIHVEGVGSQDIRGLYIGTLRITCTAAAAYPPPAVPARAAGDQRDVLAAIADMHSEFHRDLAQMEDEILAALDDELGTLQAEMKAQGEKLALRFEKSLELNTANMSSRVHNSILKPIKNKKQKALQPLRGANGAVPR